MGQDSRIRKPLPASSGFKRAQPPQVSSATTVRAKAMEAYRRQAGFEPPKKESSLDSTDLSSLNLEDLLDSDPEAA